MKRVLIIHTAFIGDIILSTPLVKKIKAKYKDVEIDYMTTPAGAAILKNNPLLKEIIVYDKKGANKGIKGILDIAFKLKGKRYDLAIVPHRYLRSSLIAFLAGIKKRIGYKNSEGKFLLNEKVNYLKDEHEVDRLLNLIELDEFENKRIELFPGKKEEEKIAKIWKEKDLSGKEIIVIAPGSRWKTKMWPSEYYNELIKKLLDDNKEIIIIGGKEEKNLPILKDERLIDLRGETSLLEVAEIIKRADLLVSNDSSPLHIGAAFDTFIIAIFGATVRELGFTPWTPRSIIIENQGLYCRPCGLHGGNSCPEKHFKCMLEIKPDEVYSEIMKNLNKK